MSDEPEVWIIDDDTLYVRELLKALSEQLAGWAAIKFITAGPVIAALDGGRRPAAVILDMMLAKDEWDNPIKWPADANPAMNGIAIAEKLRECGLRPEAIGVITAVVEKQYLEPLRETGLLDRNILIKPVEVEKIREMVRRILQAARGPK